MKNIATIGKIIVFAAGAFFVLFSNSCANQGSGPGGGPKDSIPPVIMGMIPEHYQTNYSSNEITITFDEYIVPDNLSTKLVVSPPLAEKPSIKTKGKSVIIKFDEDLIPDRTYSVDLKDGIKDYNEGNKIESIRMLFSTYDQIDTLRIGGYIVNAFNHEPVENTVVTLYSIDEDSVFSTLRPDFIAKANDEGYFLFDNLPQGDYKLYALVDMDNDLIYSQDAEQIAFIDSFITPTAEFIQHIDTIIQGEDTTISLGHTHYFPEQVHSFLFQEDIYNQFLLDFKREENDKILLTFNESLSDSFSFEILADLELKNKIYTEYGQERDSVSIWLTDTLLSNNDSLYLRVDYTALDTLMNFVTQVDTLKVFYAKKENKQKNKKKATNKVNKELVFSFSSNLKSNGFDLNVPIYLETPSPLVPFADSLILFEKAINDSTYEAVSFSIDTVQSTMRKMKIDCLLEEGTKYQISIDSAAISTFTGKTNLAFDNKFTTQTMDQYGTAIFNITGIEGPAIVQLLSNSSKEETIKQAQLQPEITFDYLKPGKYRVKLIEDRNNNGKWDTGYLNDKLQPEPVYYYNQIINIKSNWDLKENWNVDPNNFELKNLVDPDKKEDK